VIVDCAVYVDGFRRSEPLQLVDAFEAAREDRSFVWIGLADPTAEEFAAVQDELQLHPLAVEDALSAHQRPKLDVFDHTMFVVVLTADYDDLNEQIDRGEIHMFAGERSVVTVRHGKASPLNAVRQHLEHSPEMLRMGPLSVMHAVLDHIVSDYQEVIEGVENDIDEVEEQVFTSGKNATERIFRLKRQVIEFHRAAIGLQDVLEPLVRQQIPAGCRHVELPQYFRDVLDHATRIEGRIAGSRDTLGSALEANLAQVSVRQNEDMRAMAGWAAIIAVPTLMAGIWGMNFTNMPELKSVYGYPIALATIVASGFLVRWRLRRNGWL
jgi:magnesium transporter